MSKYYIAGIWRTERKRRVCVLEKRMPCKELNLEGAHVSKNEKKIRGADVQGVKGNET